jgi:hypothetical protein
MLRAVALPGAGQRHVDQVYRTRRQRRQVERGLGRELTLADRQSRRAAEQRRRRLR